MLRPKLLINFDKLFYISYQLLNGINRLLGSKKKVLKKDSFILLKFFGLGSITRIISTLDQNNIDMSKGVLCTFSSNRELCEILKIPNVYYIDSNGIMNIIKGFIEIIFKLRKSKVDWIIDFERSSNILGLLRELSTILTCTKTISFEDLPRDKNINGNMRYTLRGKTFHDLIQLTIPYLPRKESNTNPKNDLHEINLSCASHRIMLNINASDYLTLRRYPVSLFSKFIMLLLDAKPDIKIDLVGAPSEKEYVNELIELCNQDERLINRCGEWNLKQFLEQLNITRLFITNDSGPMHLAVANGIETIVLWGPTSPANSGYLNNKKIYNIFSKRSCSPCFIHPKSKAGKACGMQVDCMKDIEPKEILSLTLSLLMRLEKNKSKVVN